MEFMVPLIQVLFMATCVIEPDKNKIVLVLLD